MMKTNDDDPREDGDLSTADTVADGGVDQDQEEDGDFKP